MPLHKTPRLVWALAGLMACIAGTAQAQTASAPIRIGVIGPFSGPSSDFGTPMLHGVQLAIEEVNAVGGFLGRPFELVVKDDQGKPDEAFARS